MEDERSAELHCWSWDCTHVRMLLPQAPAGLSLPVSLPVNLSTEKKPGGERVCCFSFFNLAAA